MTAPSLETATDADGTFRLWRTDEKGQGLTLEPFEIEWLMDRLQDALDRQAGPEEEDPTDSFPGDPSRPWVSVSEDQKTWPPDDSRNMVEVQAFESDQWCAYETMQAGEHLGCIENATEIWLGTRWRYAVAPLETK